MRRAGERMSGREEKRMGGQGAKGWDVKGGAERHDEARGAHARGREWCKRERDGERRTCNLVVRAQSSLSAAIDTPNPASLSAAG